MRKKRKMRRIGSSVLPVVLLLSGVAARGDKKPKELDTYGIVGGTVFRESGYALPGAEVTIAPDPQPGQSAVKIRYPQAVSDRRGEFAFRVPVTAMRYAVTARMKGFEPQRKTVDIEGEQRLDLSFILVAKAK